MRPTTLAELLLHEIRDLCDAERRLIVALPRLARAAHDREIQIGFMQHLRQTRRQSDRLERAMQLLGGNPRGRACEVIRTLLASAHHVVDAHAAPEVKDAALIAVALRIEHYEIAGYGIARTFAELLEQTEVVHLLQENLDEEIEAEKRFSILAETIELRAPRTAVDRGATRSKGSPAHMPPAAIEPGRSPPSTQRPRAATVGYRLREDTSARRRAAGREPVDPEPQVIPPNAPGPLGGGPQPRPARDPSSSSRDQATPPLSTQQPTNQGISRRRSR